MSPPPSSMSAQLHTRALNTQHTPVHPAYAHTHRHRHTHPRGHILLAYFIHCLSHSHTCVFTHSLTLTHSHICCLHSVAHTHMLTLTHFAFLIPLHTHAYTSSPTTLTHAPTCSYAPTLCLSPALTCSHTHAHAYSQATSRLTPEWPLQGARSSQGGRGPEPSTESSEAICSSKQHLAPLPFSLSFGAWKTPNIPRRENRPFITSWAQNTASQ